MLLNTNQITRQNNYQIQIEPLVKVLYLNSYHAT